MKNLRQRISCAAVVFALAIAPALRAAVTEDEVLVIYNSAGADSNGSGQSDSVDIFDYYQSFHPGVVGFDLNDPTVSGGNISYADFVSKIRDPLRNYLNANNLQRDVVTFTLTKGIPHRIQDLNDANVGDSPSGATNIFNAGNATYATVDSELTLLWESLEEGESNGTMDSVADNVIANPYHNATNPISFYARSAITTPKSFENYGGANLAWRMRNGAALATPGHMYLTARLDGHTVDAVVASIERAQYASYNQYVDQIVIDENAAGNRDGDLAKLFNNDFGHLGDDYDETAALFAPRYASVVFDETGALLIGESPEFFGVATTSVLSGEVAALISYGGNHGASGTQSEAGYVQTYTGQLATGAIMNTLESYNAKQFGGLSGFGDQGQIATFISRGGTFGVGSAWEPFAFSVPDSEALLSNFLLRGMTWVESAWSSIPWLSWQQMVVGDPLATATMIYDPRPVIWYGDDASFGQAGDGVNWNDARNWTRDGSHDDLFQPGDDVTFAAGSGGFSINMGGPQIVESAAFQADVRLSGGKFVVRSGQVTVAAGATATVDAGIFTTRGLAKHGAGTLLVHDSSGDVEVIEGVFGGTGSARDLIVRSGASLDPGTATSTGALTVTDALTAEAGSRLHFDVDGLSLTADRIVVDGPASLSSVIEIGSTNAYVESLEPGSQLTYQLLTAQSLTGTITGWEWNGTPLLESVAVIEGGAVASYSGDGLFQTISLDATSVWLTHYAALPGDANGDGLVNDTDFNIWNAHRFMADTDWLSGDFNGDGLTDVADFNIWLGNRGRSVQIMRLGVVPEPTAGMLVLIAMFGLGRFWDRR
ncbi:MAG: hypothetical protein KDA60_06325 [Planctomycetales bacterium]|nr:hypothetical protein [Planctomycetales bacterium]